MSIGYYTWAANLSAYFNIPMHAITIRVDKHVKVQTYTCWCEGTVSIICISCLLTRLPSRECLLTNTLPGNSPAFPCFVHDWDFLVTTFLHTLYYCSG